MNALRLLAILLTVGLTACRKVPYFERFRPQASPPVEQKEAAPALAKPAAAAETPLPPAIDQTAQVIVLGYHRVVDKVRHPDTEITTTEFEAQMQALKDQGIAVISMEDFLAWRRGEKNIPPRSAMITIDDGYNVAYSLAWPILKKFGYPLTMFIYTDYVHGGPKSGGGSLTWEQLAEMRDGGVSIQSHTMTHADLRAKRSHEPHANADEWLAHELAGSKAMLEEKLGIKVAALALPYGLANEHVREFTAKAGYEAIFTVNGQKITFSTPMETLGRYMVQANQPKLFAAATTFEGSAGAGAAAVSAVAVASIHPQPAEDSTIEDPSPLIQANLTSFGTIDPSSVTMRVSGLGEVAARFEPQTKIVTYQARNLLPNKYTVILAARSLGQRIECRWSFTLESRGDSKPAVPAGPPR